MGKIRIKSFDQDDQKKQQDRKKAKKEAKKTSKAAGLKGGERVVSVGPGADEMDLTLKPKTQAEEKKVSKKKAKFIKKKVKSKRYINNLSFLKKDTLYSLSQALATLKKLKSSKFDETVELHINTKEKGISGQVTLPHGTGRQLRIKVVDSQNVDDLIAAVEKGKIEFDVLVATPSVMAKLAKVARVLGPKGLMPNPKMGTITDKPDQLMEKLSKGQTNYKCEPEAAVVHVSVGKLSFEEKKLEDNINAMLTSIGSNKIEKVTLKSTMSPGIKLKV